MASFGIEIRNTDGSYTQVGSILGVDKDQALTAVRERLTRRKNELDPLGQVYVWEKNSGAKVFADAERPTVQQMTALK